MEYFNISTTWNESYEEIYNSFNYYEHNYYQYCTIGCFTGKDALILYVSTLVVICISLPLTLLAITNVFLQVRKDHGAPVYVINLLISDLVQLLCMIVWVAKKNKLEAKLWETLILIYCFGLLSSVGFMVFISLERYLLIVWPLWYRFRRTIKTYVVVCVLVWILPPVFFLPFYYRLGFVTTQAIVGALLLLPLPLFIFSLGGTLKALSGSISVSSDEKRRIVAVLVVVLLIYTLLFLPPVIFVFVVKFTDIISDDLQLASNILVQLSPLADLILYIFMRKGTTDKILASLMEHFSINTTGKGSYDENSFNHNNSDSYFRFCNAFFCYEGNEGFIRCVSTWIIICISLPLTLLAIYSLSSLVRKDHSAPVYVINLLISDIIQLLCMIGWVTDKKNSETVIFFGLHHYTLLSSVGFMVCISLERYLVIVWPMWYRFRRTIKTSVVVCVLVWILPLVCIIPLYFMVDLLTTQAIVGVYLLLPLPLFIFFLGGTLKALSGSISVSSDEKRRIVSVLVVVLLIYTLLFMPSIIWLLAGKDIMNSRFIIVSEILIQLSPLADLILYIFMTKGTTDKILASLCCCRMELQEINSIDDSNCSFLKQINWISDQ
ncbi:uncharacterized protein LOC125019038 [Mugil cephalus]|uniref:uncharacterized protein LOC125019038 n=1 Tax=Mugil cephalus TaxID=48193 RepID=UPI001FB76857|nr:uncharacterized protein LOC125019038 [Mugil cephalus]